VSDFDARIERVRDLLRGSWSTSDGARLALRIERAVRRRRRQRMVGAIAVGAVAVSAALLAVAPGDPKPVQGSAPQAGGTGGSVGRAPNGPAAGIQPERSASPAPAAVQLERAGVVAETERGGQMRVVAVEPGRTRVEVVSGRTRFERAGRTGPARPADPSPIGPAAHPAIEVQAGAVSVTISEQSWSFSVARHRDAVEVVVERGTLLVREGDRSTQLSSGERRTFSAASDEPHPAPARRSPAGSEARDAASPAAPVDDAAAGSRAAPAINDGTVAGSPAAPVDDGTVAGSSAPPIDDGTVAGSSAPPIDDGAGAESPAVAGPAGLGIPEGPADPVFALLREADQARSEGDSERAARILRAALAERGGDRQAALVAFTLARVLFEDLGRHAAAAEAFAQAHVMAGSSQLAEDALAREVAAWRRAGRVDRARQRATDYVRRYPRGYRLAQVRRDGGLK
jgi:transmembrane sensor